MYTTTVIYPLPTNPKSRLLVFANPMTSIIESFRYAFFQVGDFHWMALAYSSVFMILALLTGMLLFNRIEKSFMDTV